MYVADTFEHLERSQRSLEDDEAAARGPATRFRSGGFDTPTRKALESIPWKGAGPDPFAAPERLSAG